MPKTLSLVGQKFTRLLVLEDGPFKKRPDGRGRSTGICLCDCGTRITVRNYDLVSGNTKSCGCLNRDGSMKPSKTHGHASHQDKSGAYRAWQAMHQRCSPTVEASKNYSERGIRVCERWRKFENFLADMGERPLGMTLERKENSGIYEPANCKWASRTEQARNKRNNRTWTINGITGCTAELAEHFGLPKAVVYTRIHKGWEPDEAFTIPVWSRRKRLTK